MISPTVVEALLDSRLDAVEVLRAADALDPEHLHAMLDLVADVADSDAETAGRLLDVVEQAARPAKAEPAAAAAGYLRARLLVQSGHPEQALAHITRARDHYLHLGSRMAALRTDLGLMHVLDDLGRHEEAATVGRRLLDALRDIDPGPEAAGLRAAAHGNLGVSVGFTGRHEEAIEAYRRAEEAWRELGQEHEAAAALANRGIELLALGQARAGLDCLQRATAAFEAGTDQRWLGKCLGHRGAALAALGRYPDALADFERARTLLESVDERTESWRLSIATASTLQGLGLHEESMALVLEVIPQLRRAGLDHDLAHALAVSGHGHRQAGRLDSARDAFTEAASLYAAVGDPPSQAGALLDLSRVCGGDEAAAHAHRAAELVDGAAWPGVRCLCLVRLAELAGPDQHAAADHLAQARLLADGLGVPHLRLAVAQGEACRLRRGGALDAAVHRFDEALDLVEGIATPLLDETLRAAYLRSSRETRNGLIAALVERGRPADIDRAARLADQAKARTLLEIRQGALHRARDPIDDVDPGDAADSLTGRLEAAYSALFSAEYDRRDSARRRVEELERQIAVRRALAPRPDPPPPAAGTPPTALQPAVPALAYHVVDDQIVAFVPHPDGHQQVRRVSDVASLTRLLDDLDAHVGRHAAGAVARHGAARAAACRRLLGELYLRVFAPVRDLLAAPPNVPAGAAQPLLVVPHGPLHRVPFHALHDGRDYLVARWLITIAPSLALAALPPSPARPRRTAVIGVADASTPLIEDEARRVARVSGTAEPVLGAQATLDRVRRAIAGADLVHLACHGLFRDSNPAFSSLRLADRWVRAAELADVITEGATLVLSACETARVSRDGDEAMGLARSLLAAGARCVVVSQWVADDRSTASLMVRLHRGLAGGATPSTALREAQLATLADHPHPFHWAPFIPVGAVAAGVTVESVDEEL